MNKKISIRDIALVGVMAAAVFVASQISIEIPLGLGDHTRVHIGNGICLFSGLLLGPFFGGLSAGLGSMIFDLLNPLYISSAPFTFAFKFLMAYVCGKIAWAKDSKAMNRKRNIVGSILGALTYIVLYIFKSYLKSVYVLGMPRVGAIGVVLQKISISLINGIAGVIIAILLIEALRPIYRRIRNK